MSAPDNYWQTRAEELEQERDKARAEVEWAARRCECGADDACAFARERDEARVALAEAYRRLEQSTDWHQQRYNAVRAWVESEVRPLSENVARRYYSVVANGTPCPYQPADWSSTVHGLTLRAEKAEKERDEARAEVGKLRAALEDAEAKAAKHVMTVDPTWSRRESEEAWKRAAQTLAEDLRAMTRERDEARAALVSARGEMIAAMAEEKAAVEAAEMLTKERDEARAEVEVMNKLMRQHRTASVGTIDRLEETEAELRKEIWRLNNEVSALRREGLRLATDLERAEKERDEARAEATLLRLERGKMHLALRRVLEALGNGSRANEGAPVDFLCLVPAEVWEVVADMRAALADANAKAEAARAELAALKASLEAT